MAVVTVSQSGPIALIRVENPPVNAISQAVRQGLAEAITQIDNDAAVQAAVLICSGRTFMAGADASELGKPPVPPHLNDLTDHIEGCSKPLVAAIHGQALGGGLEIALACSHRVAVDSARFGLPEVNLGFVPGAGGTQRLPRLIGVQPALSMAVEGKPIGAAKALEQGLIDQIVTVLEAEAIAFATTLIGQNVDARRLHHQIAADSFDAGLFDEWRAYCAKRKRGLDAPLAVIDAVEAATGSDAETGKLRERALSLELRKSPQSKALRHIFFAERSSAKVDGIDPKSARAVDHVAVIGAGTMGAGIAHFFASNARAVTLVEISDEAAQAGLERIRANLAQSVKRGKLSQDKADATLARIATTTDYADLAQVDLVIEAAVENFDIKTQIFAKLDQSCKPDAILATNTSYLDINALAATTQRPERVAGLHFFSPAHVMKLVEVIRPGDVAHWVIATLTQLTKSLGKIPVVSGVCHGFIGNRIYQSYQREAGLLMLETGSPEVVDRSMRAYGMAMGPYQVLDLSGIDIGYLMRKSLPAGSVHPHAFQVHDRLVEMERKGRKTGAGFYTYGGDTPVIDDTVLELVQSVAQEAGIRQTTLPETEIAARCVRAMATEAEAILAEGIAAKPSDVDVVLVNGYGFPRHKGGPMFATSQGN